MKKIIIGLLMCAVLACSLFSQSVPKGRNLWPAVLAHTESASSFEAVAITDYSVDKYTLTGMDVESETYQLYCTGTTKGLMGKLGSVAYCYSCKLSVQNGKIVALVSGVKTGTINLLSGSVDSWKNGGLTPSKLQKDIATEFAGYVNCSDEEYNAMDLQLLQILKL